MSRKPETFDNVDIAVALAYDGSNAPRVTATGRDAVAEEIIANAARAGIPRYPEPTLAPVLAQIPSGAEIPEDLYRAVAEIIAFVYWMEGKTPEGFQPPPGESAGAEEV